MNTNRERCGRAAVRAGEPKAARGLARSARALGAGRLRPCRTGHRHRHPPHRAVREPTSGSHIYTPVALHGV
jgi:hypothetical protein